MPAWKSDKRISAPLLTLLLARNVDAEVKEDFPQLAKSSQVKRKSTQGAIVKRPQMSKAERRARVIKADLEDLEKEVGEGKITRSQFAEIKDRVVSDADKNMADDVE